MVNCPIFKLVFAHFFFISQIPYTPRCRCPFVVFVVPLACSKTCYLFLIFHNASIFSVSCPDEGRRSPRRVPYLKGRLINLLPEFINRCVNSAPSQGFDNPSRGRYALHVGCRYVIISDCRSRAVIIGVSKL
jgi:hypothetical protein